MKSTSHGRLPTALSSSGQSSGHDALQRAVQHWYVGAKTSGAFSVSDRTDENARRSTALHVSTAATTAKSPTALRERRPGQKAENFTDFSFIARYVVPKQVITASSADARYEYSDSHASAAPRSMSASAARRPGGGGTILR